MMQMAELAELTMGGKAGLAAATCRRRHLAHYEPPSVEELLERLLKKMDVTVKYLDEHNVGITNVQRIGEDVILTAYAGGKFSTHVDKIDRFPSSTLIDRLRLLF